jgi:hypothetical protein
MSGGGAFDDAVAVSVRHFMQLRKMEQAYTPELLEQILDTVLNQQIGTLRPYQAVERDALRAELERRFSVVIEPPRILEGEGEHRVWLPERRADPGTEWPLWNEYRRILLDVRLRPPPVVAELDRTTDEVLGRIEDPTDLDRPWDRRGMVVGQVQSGKTGHYTGLICKALDTGYKVVIVLAGPYNNLRSQVQRRLDEELLQFDTSRPEVPLPTEEGVVLGAPGAGMKIIPLTSQLEDGDFKIQVATHVTVGPGHSPILLVVKKNATILRTLLRFFTTGPGARPDASRNRKVVSGAPLLVIDDEADYGSINTAEVPRDENGEFVQDYDPTRINQLIRELLRSFRQCAYVGYTATPFANIFIHPDQPHQMYGEDLFPESFIVSLQPPSDYMGPKDVFGIGNRPDPLPLVRYVDDYGNFVPDGHRIGYQPPDLCSSVREAMRAFLLACAIRRVRGQRTVHNSMLIHVTRYVSTQKAVADLVRAELDTLRDRLKFGDGAATPPLRDELRSLWEGDFQPTSNVVGRPGEVEAWSDVDAELLPSVEKTHVRIINGSAGDVLDYKQNEAQGLNVVAVGGDKLSRGLTLEGLTVSYYLRTSRKYLYDTLLQMGRWFGYRPGYRDLCRIYTTDSLAWNYERIAAADEELRTEFNDMADRRETPRSYGLRVRTHPGLLVTSAVKMRNSVTIDISYQGNVSETTVFDPSAETVDWNLRETDAFLQGVHEVPVRLPNCWMWNGVPREAVTTFLKKFRTHPDATDVDSRILANFIDQQNGTENLRAWSIALLDRTVSAPDDEEQKDSTAPEVRLSLGGREVTSTRRSPKRNFPGEKVTIGRLVSPRHEALDITDNEWDQAVSRRRDASMPIPDRKTSEVAAFAREARPKDRGLMLIYPLNPRHMELLVRDPSWKGRVRDPRFTLPNPVIGLALSFPGGADTIPLRYTVNPVWLEKERGGN